MSSTSSRLSMSSTSTVPSPHLRPTSLRSGSVSSVHTASQRNSLLLAGAASQFSLLSLDDLSSSAFSNTRSSDPASQNFSFDDIFEFGDNTISSSATKYSDSRKKSTTNQVTATYPRAPSTTTRPRRQRQEETTTTTTSRKQQSSSSSNFSFSHYPPRPQSRRSTSFDHSSKAAAVTGRVPSRTSPGAARLHEMLARGR